MSMMVLAFSAYAGNSIVWNDECVPGRKWSFEARPEGKKVTVAFRFSDKGANQNIEFAPGNDEAPLKIFLSAEKDFLNCGREIGNYYFNGVAERSFSWPAKLQGWSEFYAQRQFCNLNERDFILELVPFDGKYRIYLDGMMVGIWNEVPALKVSGSILVSKPEIREAVADGLLFETVDISRRLNSDAVGAEKVDVKTLPTKNSMITGIPFLMPENGEANNIDLGVSWFREGGLAGAYAGNRSPFGGRWGGAMTCNPTRIQFKIPSRQYNAVYLLAATEGGSGKIPDLTVQFYRTGSGFPKNFVAAGIPLFSRQAVDGQCIGVKNVDGKKRNLWLVKIDVDSDMLQEFAPLETIELELTKLVLPYRCFPDPAYYSRHGAGLPSGVHVFAMTLGVRPVEISWTPEKYAGIFQEGDEAVYRVALRNLTPEEKVENLELHLKGDSAKQQVTLKPFERKEVIFKLPLRNFGWHEVKLLSSSGEFKRSLVYLRKRDDYGKFRDLEDPGHLFGTWPSGSHGSPSEDIGMRVMAMAGAKTTVGSLKKYNIPNADSSHKKELAAVMEEFGVRSYLPFGFIDFRYTGFDFPRPEFKVTFDNSRPDEMRAELLKMFKKLEQKPSQISQPRIVRIFGEPGGIGAYRYYAEQYGEKIRDMNESESARYLNYCNKLRLTGGLLREHYPDLKILMPHGDPMFAIPFLQDKELAPLVDGVALDYGLFDRMPEMQLHQCSLHRTWFLFDAWKKYKKDVKPLWGTFEGPAYGPVVEGSLTARESAAYKLRSALLLSGYGVNLQFTNGGPFAPASYWGEQHYAGGYIDRALNPYPSYSMFAVMTRHLGSKDFVKWLATSSLTTYCYEYLDAAQKQRMYVLWVIRGTRDVSFDRDVKYFDLMDNEFTLKKGEKLTVSDWPVFVYADAPQFAWSEAVHADSVLSEYNLKLGSAVNWTQVQEEEPLYTEANPEHVRRFPAVMETEKSPEGLILKLGKQPVERGVMPYFTSFKASESIKIPGKARYLTMRVNANSDWGRLVYVLRDASGRKWVSVGMKNAWNADDTQSMSSFNFDGWRYVKMELPAHSPYDGYRENGTSWWGTDDANAVVKLPLTIEKIIVERRSKVFYANDLIKCPDLPVVLGDLYAEYASAEDRTKIVHMEMPEPPVGKELNPIRELAEAATLPAISVTAVDQPSTHYDGTNGVFIFQTAENAVYYDVYLSLHADGRGAIKLGKKLKTSPAPIRGFLADTDFYAFVVYYDKTGKHSAPGAGFKFKLADMFGMK